MLLLWHHNQAICPQKFGNSPQPMLKSESMVVAPAQQDHDEIERPPEETLNSTSVQIQTLVSSGERVFALVPVQSSDRKRTISVKLLLDSASHRSERLAKQLQLTSQFNVSLSVSTFAARKPHDVSTCVVECNVITKEKSCMHFHANVIEQITGPIQRGTLQPADVDFLMSISGRFYSYLRQLRIKHCGSVDWFRLFLIYCWY